MQSGVQSREDILAHVRQVLADLFQIDPARVTPETNLYNDLEIDSIDAVDLLDRIRRYTGKKVSGEDFRSVRTIGDLLNVIERLLAK
jgi:acyl carrier protein